MTKTTILERGNEVRRIVLIKGDVAYHIYCEVLASDFHKVGHRELLETCKTSNLANSLYRLKVNFLKGFQYEEVVECLA
jgi:hypothetical protein